MSLQAYEKAVRKARQALARDVVDNLRTLREAGYSDGLYLGTTGTYPRQVDIFYEDGKIIAQPASQHGGIVQKLIRVDKIPFKRMVYFIEGSDPKFEKCEDALVCAARIVEETVRRATSCS
ncbi:MAG: hypothetical protein HY513_05795 [Candidatus Aenigmarchaeota archaeon]|nr:hypothetical protein [Candidatus Aenigmarchaeota archaeon]